MSLTLQRKILKLISKSEVEVELLRLHATLVGAKNNAKTYPVRKTEAKNKA